MRDDLRNAHIGFGVGVVVLVVGCYLLRNAGEDALGLLGLAVLVVSVGTFILLEDREERRQKRDQ
jgi:multisubunit Na+/H+ antiporter MnhB subunit